jgi:putative tryptophan/tyrosine transport system substrate-binding protein
VHSSPFSAVRLPGHSSRKRSVRQCRWLASSMPAPPPERTQQVAAFRKGLAEGGYQEGQNVRLEFAWAEGQYGRFGELAADLVRRGADVIAVPGSGGGALAAKTAAPSTAIVFGTTGDPVEEGLVASLNRPGGNATGVNFFVREVIAKRMQFLRELVPYAKRIALLVNPTDAENYQSSLRDVRAAAAGEQILVHDVTSGRDIDEAFAQIARENANALFVAPGTFFNTRRVQLVVLTARQALPAIFSTRAYPDVGGLMSYGTDVLDAFRQIGVYTARRRSLRPDIYRGAVPCAVRSIRAVPGITTCHVGSSTVRAVSPDELTVNRLRGRALPADEELPLMSAYPAAALPSARPPPATPQMALWGAQEAAAGSRTY